MSYITAYFQDEMKFYDSNDSLVITLTKPGTNGFISYYDSTQTPKWASIIGGLYSSSSYYSIKYKVDNFLYITGVFQETLTLYYANNIHVITYTNPNPDLTETPSTIMSFVAKYDLSGTPLWASFIGGNPVMANQDIVPGLCLSNNNIYLVGMTGLTSEQLQLYNSNSNVPIISKTTYDITNTFIIKYSTSGSPLWCTIMGGFNQSTSICTDNNYLYITGAFQDTLNFYDLNDSFTASESLTNPGINGFIVKYGLDGNHVWGTIIGDTSSRCFSICTDNTSIYVTGTFEDTLILYDTNKDPIKSSTTHLDKNGFIAKYDLLGTPLFLSIIDGMTPPLVNFGINICTDYSKLYITFYTNVPCTLYDANDISKFATNNYNISVGNNGNLFTLLVAQYDLVGSPKWVRAVYNVLFVPRTIYADTKLHVNSTSTTTITESVTFNVGSPSPI